MNTENNNIRTQFCVFPRTPETGQYGPEDYWQRPITADQLQAEMERMASHTKQPDVLRNTGIWTGSEMIV